MGHQAPEAQVGGRPQEGEAAPLAVVTWLAVAKVPAGSCPVGCQLVARQQCAEDTPLDHNPSQGEQSVGLVVGLAEVQAAQGSQIAQ